MNYITLNATYFTPKETEILIALLKINNEKAIGSINWSFRKIASYFKCSTVVIKRIFRKLRKMNLLDETRIDSKQYLINIKEEIYQYFDYPIGWIEKQLNMPIEMIMKKEARA